MNVAVHSNTMLIINMGLVWTPGIGHVLSTMIGYIGSEIISKTALTIPDTMEFLNKSYNKILNAKSP